MSSQDLLKLEMRSIAFMSFFVVMFTEHGLKKQKNIGGAGKWLTTCIAVSKCNKQPFLIYQLCVYFCKKKIKRAVTFVMLQLIIAGLHVVCFG